MKFNREELIEEIANKATDDADVDALMDFFRDGQIAFLDDMTDKDLIRYANENYDYDLTEE